MELGAEAGHSVWLVCELLRGWDRSVSCLGPVPSLQAGSWLGRPKLPSQGREAFFSVLDSGALGTRVCW